MAKSNKSISKSTTIAQNKKATHDYFLEQRFEAGIALEGWEVKSLRAGKAQLVDSYVIIRKEEVFLLGGLISPLSSTSTHKTVDPTRTRKLLLHRREIKTLMGRIKEKGYTLVPLSLYWKGARIKICIGLARGKKHYDKRASSKDRDWSREKARLFKKDV